MDVFFPQKSKGPIQHSQQEQLFFFGVHVHMCLAGDRPGVASREVTLLLETDGNDETIEQGSYKVGPCHHPYK